MKPTLKTLFILGVFFCTFVFQNTVFNGLDPSGLTEMQPPTEAGWVLDSPDAHEDDFASLENITPHVLAGLASHVRGDHMSSLSHTPNPLLPPPKNI
jgi:hypothetical protein